MAKTPGNQEPVQSRVAQMSAESLDSSGFCHFPVSEGPGCPDRFDFLPHGLTSVLISAVSCHPAGFPGVGSARGTESERRGHWMSDYVVLLENNACGVVWRVKGPV